MLSHASLLQTSCRVHCSTANTSLPRPSMALPQQASIPGRLTSSLLPLPFEMNAQLPISSACQVNAAAALARHFFPWPVSQLHLCSAVHCQLLLSKRMSWCVCLLPWSDVSGHHDSYTCIGSAGTTISEYNLSLPVHMFQYMSSCRACAS